MFIIQAMTGDAMAYDNSRKSIKMLNAMTV